MLENNMTRGRPEVEKRGREGGRDGEREGGRNERTHIHNGVFFQTLNSILLVLALRLTKVLFKTCGP